MGSNNFIFHAGKNGLQYHLLLSYASFILRVSGGFHLIYTLVYGAQGLTY